MALQWKDCLNEGEFRSLRANFCYDVHISAGWARKLTQIKGGISNEVFKKLALQLIHIGVGSDIPPERRDIEISENVYMGINVRVFDKDPPEETVANWVAQMGMWNAKTFTNAAIRAIPKESIIEPPHLSEDEITTSQHINDIGKAIIEKNGGLPDLPHIEDFKARVELAIGQARWQDVFRKVKFNGKWGSLNFKDGEAHSVHEDNYLETEEGKHYYCFGVHFMTQVEGRARQWHACTPRSVRKWSSIFKHAEEEIAKSLLDV